MHQKVLKQGNLAKRFIFSLLAILVLVLSGFGVYSLGYSQSYFNPQFSFQNPLAQKSNISSQTASNNIQNVPEKVEEKKPEIIAPLSLSVNTLFFGDVFWGRYIDDWSKASNLKFAYPFSGLSSFNRENYQAWIADLECPITSTYLSSATQDNLLKFSCPVGYTVEAAKWFNAFTLANNHMDNMQEVDGLKQTRENLEANKIQYFGHYDNAYRDAQCRDEICEVVSLPSKSTFPELKENQVKQESNFLVPVALCGYHNVFKLPTEEDLSVISEYSKYLPTVIMPHQGQEYKTVADELQQTYYRKMLDLGADAVIGDHTHSVQNTEAYKGKLIVYSMGNFIFDQQSAPLYRQGIAVNLDFNFAMDANLQKWSALSPTCLKFKDACLTEAKKQNLTKPKFTLKTDIIPTDNSNKLAKKADENTAQAILKQARWMETKIKLDYSYAGK